MLINESAARAYWRGAVGGPVGARLDLWGLERTVVGVVGDVKDTPWATDARPALYSPYAQTPFQRELFLVVRGAIPPAEIVDPIARVVRALDPALPVWNVRVLTDVAGDALARRRFGLWLIGTFALAALVLAVVGIYGVVDQLVAARATEFGVRRALGAPAHHITALVIDDTARLAGAGIALGAVAAFGVTRMFASMLFEVTPGDPATFAAVGALLVAVAIASGYIPARRAGRADPMAAVRAE